MAIPLPKPKKPRWRRVSTYVVLVVVGTPLVLGGTAWFLTRPERLARAVESALGENIHGTVHIEKAHLSWRGKLVVENLRLGLVGASGPYARVLEAPRASISLSRRQLLNLRVWVKAVELDAPVLHVVENSGHQVNLVGLGVKDTGGKRQPIPLPLFTLNKGKILFEKLAKDGLTCETLAQWELSGRLTPTGFQAGNMEFHAKRPDTGKDVDLAGSFDLGACTASGKITNACLRPEMALLTPREVRRWWRTLSATGEVPQLEASCQWKKGFHINEARMQVRGLTLHPNLRPFFGKLANTLAANIMIRAADQLWFDNIDGSAVVSDDLLRLPDLRATAHGEQLGFGTVAAKLSGQLNLVGHNQWGMAFTTDSFELADSIPILDVFPDVRNIYRRFNPSGTFRISGRAESAGLDQVPELEARVELIDAKANYSVRPYPVEHLSGTLRATLHSLLIENLHGQGVAGGNVSVRGRIEPLTDDAGADITVELEDVPFGEALLGALGPKTAAAVRRFVSQSTTEALRARGLKAPEPGGHLDATLQITRAKGAKGVWGIEANVDPVGMQIILPQWPYPLKIEEGSLTVSETKVRGEGLKVSGPSGGLIAASLAADDTDHDGNFSWRVGIDEAQVPVDEWFYAALPPNAEKSARLLNVEGNVRVKGELKETEASKDGSGLSIALHGTVEDAKANPFGGGYLLDHVAMRMTLREHDFTIDQASCAHGDTAFEATEKVAWNPAFANRMEVKVKDVVFEPALAQLVPAGSDAHKKVVDAFEKWQFKGMGDGHLVWEIAPPKNAGAQEEERFVLDVDPKHLDMRSPIGAKENLLLADMRGRVTLAGDKVLLAGIQGSFEGGRLAVDGTLVPGEKDLTADLKISGKTSVAAGVLPGTVNALLPAGIRQSVLDAKVSGQAQVKQGTLSLAPGRTDCQAVLATDNLSFDLGLPFRQVQGQAKVHALSAQGQTTTTADLQLASCGIYERKLTDGSAKMMLAPDGAWQLPQFKAKLAGGLLCGSVLGKSPAWALDADLSDAALEGIKNPTGWDGVSAKSGILGARVRLSSQDDGMGQLMGDGDFVLTGSDLGANNGKLALIEALNLVRPGSGPINRGEGHFTALGNRLLVDRMEISSPGGLAFVGEGSVLLPSTQLDLEVATRNQRQTGMGSKLLGEVAQYVTTPITNELLGLRVRGTLSAPIVEINALVDVRRALWELLPGMKRK